MYDETDDLSRNGKPHSGGSLHEGHFEAERQNDAPATPVRQDVPTATIEAKPAAPVAKEAKARRPLVRAGLGAALVLALGAGAYYGHYWWVTGRYMVSTDDAYVGARSATLSPKVSGYISSLMVGDNAAVQAGDVVAQLDDGDYKLAVQSARDQVGVQKATIERISKQVGAQEAAVDQAKAQIASAEAGLTRAELELKRQLSLAGKEYASRQTLEQAQANRDQAVASVQNAKAGLEAASANVDVLKAQQMEAQRTLAQYETSLAKAERDLSFTTIRAPYEGVIGNRAVQVGDYVQPSQRLASLVPLDAVYIDANFKETQLAGLRPGQPVSVTVDALPGRKIDARVESVAPASGSVFSLLPPDNATGNFTKVVQRVPVRIHVARELAEQSVLRPGMSVIVKVDTKPGAVAAIEAPTRTAGVR